MAITLSERAAEKIKKVFQENKMPANGARLDETQKPQAYRQQNDCLK